MTRDPHITAGAIAGTVTDEMVTAAQAAVPADYRLPPHLMCAALEAALAVPAEPVDGWVMVPVTPTVEMICAGVHMHENTGISGVPVWAAMLAAAPQPAKSTTPAEDEAMAQLYIIPRDMTDEEWGEVIYNVNRKADQDIPLWRIKDAVSSSNFIAGHRGRDILKSTTPAEDDVDAAAKLIAKWIGYSWAGLGDRDVSDKYPDFAPVSGNFQGGRPALRKLARSILKSTTPAQGRVAELEAALKPFAKEADGFRDDEAANRLTDYFMLDSELTVGDLRRARAALSNAGGEE